jgi:uncharacterized circularly permuted ATP-grasp superfamily protein
MTTKNKDNEMICTGAIPPQVVMGTELYQMYMKATMNYWQLYVALMGIDHWTKYMNQFKVSE